MESEEGVGSTFKVILPLDVENSSMDRAPLGPSQSRLERGPQEPASPDTKPPQFPIGTHILLCEDGELNQVLIKRILENHGAEVTIANNGLEGLEAVVKEPSAYHAVLMDMQMPLMDGYTATGKIRESGFSRPIIALTAHAMRGDKERCLGAGCSAFLSKPIEFDKFFATIDEHLQK